MNCNVRESSMKIISDLLTDICEESTTNKDNNNGISTFIINIDLIKPFLSKKKPAISISKFIQRIIKYTQMENSTLVLMLIYIDRLCDLNKFKLNYFNIHKIIIGSMIIAIKYNEDDYYDVSFYSKITGVSQKEFKKIEYEMLSLLDYNLYVNEDIFYKYDNYLKAEDSDDETETEEEDTVEIKHKDKIELTRNIAVC